MLIDLFVNSDPMFLAAAKADIAGATADASKIALGFAQNFWSNIFKMGLFGRICLAVKPILFAGVIYKGWLLFEETSSSVKQGIDPARLIGSLLSLFAVFIMMNKSGEIAFYSVLGLRNYTSNVSDTLLKGVAADFQAFSPLNKLSKNINSKPVLKQFQSELRTCASIQTSAPNCVTAAINNLETGLASQDVTAADEPELFTEIAKLKSDAVAAAANSQTPVQNKNYIQQGLDVVGDALKSAADLGNVFQHIVEVLLTGVAFAFFLALELTLLLFGLLFPINLTLSLFDPSPLKTWIGGFWTLVNAKLCFSIIVGIVVQLQLWMESNNGSVGLFVIELLLAVFAPVLTFFYCQSTALVLASAMSSLTQAGFRGVGTAAAKSAAGVAKGGASIIKKAASKIISGVTNKT
jgi:hypothetical protein